jgi:cysteine desulfurase
MPSPIYLDHNATTPLHPQVLASMTEVLNHFGNPSSMHKIGKTAGDLLEKSRQQVADFFETDSSGVIFCASGSEADNLALRGVAASFRGVKNHIISTNIEHSAVLNTCVALQKQGFRVTYLPANAEGVVSLADFKKSLTPETFLVSIMSANNETGAKQPVRDIGALCREKGILMHVDAIQSVGYENLSLKNNPFDLVSIAAHKFYGPKGAAALAVRSEILSKLMPLITGGSQENSLRAGTENLPAIAGMAQALTMMQTAGSTYVPKMEQLRDYLQKKITENIPDIRINAQNTPRNPNTLNISFKGVMGDEVLAGLDQSGICVSTGSACRRLKREMSHVIKAMGVPEEYGFGTIRFSLGESNTPEQMDFVVDQLKKVVEKLRK